MTSSRPGKRRGGISSKSRLALYPPPRSAATPRGAARSGAGGSGGGGRGEAAAMNAMNADKGIRIVAMADIRLDRVQEKRAALKLKYPEQAAVSDDHCFKGFDGYKHVIESSDVVIIANAAKFHPLHLKAAIGIH